MRRNHRLWPFLTVLLAALLLFAAVGVPRIAVYALERTYGRIVTVPGGAEDPE